MFSKFYINFFVLCLLSNAALGQEDLSLSKLLDRIKAAKISNGFSVRAELIQSFSNGSQRKFKISIVGQVSKNLTRLLLKPLSGEISKQSQYLLISSDSGLNAQVIINASTNIGISQEVNLATEIGDWGIYSFDLLELWQQWNHQEWRESEKVIGLDCKNIVSSIDEIQNNSGQVVSCIDIKDELTLKNVIFDNKQKILRATNVEKITRDSEGRLKPLQTLTTDGDRKTQIRIYSADDEYEVNGYTFKYTDPLGSQISR